MYIKILSYSELHSSSIHTIHWYLLKITHSMAGSVSLPLRNLDPFLRVIICRETSLFLMFSHKIREKLFTTIHKVLYCNASKLSRDHTMFYCSLSSSSSSTVRHTKAQNNYMYISMKHT